MRELERKYFELLKENIREVMQRSYPGIKTSVSEWKGQEITDFQEDLRIKVKANISDKWFYTHLKGSHTRLPRIDMLNMLSQYTGYANWDDFIYHNPFGTAQGKTDTPVQSLKPVSSQNHYFIIVPLLTIIVLAIFIGLFFLLNTREYRFSFIDAKTHSQITDPNLQITLLDGADVSTHLLTDPTGLFRIRTHQSKMRMIISAPLYQTDTIEIISTEREHNQTISLWHK